MSCAYEIRRLEWVVWFSFWFRCGFKIAERNTKKRKNLKSWVNVGWKEKANIILENGKYWRNILDQIRKSYSLINNVSDATVLNPVLSLLTNLDQPERKVSVLIWGSWVKLMPWTSQAVDTRLIKYHAVVTKG